MTRRQFGKTWWGEQWLNALADIDYDNRLPRGRSYANSGAVTRLSVEGGEIHAEVKGSRRQPYRVSVAMPAMGKDEAGRLVDRVAADPVSIGRLLNRELDPAVSEHAHALGIQVFPRRWSDLAMACSCPDWAVPCKHLAAVIYVLSREIDGDPFLVFSLRGLDLVGALERRGVVIGGEADRSVPPFDELLPAGGSGADSPGDAERLANIDFSRLPNLLEPLTRLLPPQPAFAGGRNVCKVWQTAIRQVARQARAMLDRMEAPAAGGVKGGPCFGPADRPILVFNGDGRAAVAGIDTVTDVQGLADALSKVAPDALRDLQPQVAALHTVRLAALHMLAAGAAVPSVFAAPHGVTGLYWLPATVDTAVHALIDEMAVALPSGMVICGESRQPVEPTAQARMACAAFLDFWIRQWNEGAGQSGLDGKVAALFFGAPGVRFDGPGEGAMPAGIRVWLSRLHLADRAYVPMLRLAEADDAFALTIEIEPGRNADPPTTAAAPVPLSTVLADPQWERRRYAVVQTVSLLAETYPPLADHVSAGAAQPLPVSADALPNLLFEVLPAIRLLGVRTVLPKALGRLLRPRASMEVGAAPDAGGFLKAGDLFRFDWRVAIGDHLLDAEAFEALVADATGIVRFRGEYVFLDPGEIERLRRQLEKPPKVSGFERTRIALAGEYQGAPVRLTESALERVERLRQTPAVEPPRALRAQLRPYQQRGFQWLYGNAVAGFGSVIADDMGLGKTLQVIAAILHLNETGELNEGKALVIVPTTLLTNWVREIERFAPTLTVAVYHGPERALESKARPDVLLTTYGVARSDAAKLKALPWRLLAVDEAQNVKNPNAAQTKAVKSIPARSHIAMSGTPVENRLSEYWSVMDLVNRGYLGTVTHFQREFGVPIQVHHDPAAAERFRRVTAPFLLRRLKTDRNVITDLPDKIEQDQFCQLTAAQSAVYESVVREAMQVIEGVSDTFERQGLVLQMILALKQICNHPAQYLKQGAADPAQSGKAALFLDLLDDIHDRHEKVLVFTQFREMGDLLARWIGARYGPTPAFLHGGVGRKARDAMVERFQTDRTERVFILSLKAGGTGLNLTAASHVIHYDLWWNPAVEAQATDRAYRIGQTRNVQVHRLITRATFEERINEMIQSKRALADMTVAAGEQWIGNLSDARLRELVRLGGEGI